MKLCQILNDVYERVLTSMVYTFLDKKIGSAARTNVNEVPAQE